MSLNTMDSKVQANLQIQVQIIFLINLRFSLIMFQQSNCYWTIIINNFNNVN